ncbi:MAG: VOC family protein [Planctomycetaceae bacterium]|nr:VOC family protein [Planctomycetaceae bacterium]
MKGTLMQVEPYLSFEGRCEEALEFYKKTIGAEVTALMRFKDNPDSGKAGEGCGPGATMPPGIDNKVMHSSFRVGKSTIMATDGSCNGKATFAGISLTLAVDTPSEAEKYFTALSNEGSVTMPLGKTFFSPAFGMVADKFGVHWMVIATPAA